jgi:hypothetical protein
MTAIGAPGHVAPVVAAARLKFEDCLEPSLHSILASWHQRVTDMLHWWLVRSPYVMLAVGCILWLGLEWQDDDRDFVAPASILIGTLIGWIWTEVSKPR